MLIAPPDAPINARITEDFSSIGVGVDLVSYDQSDDISGCEFLLLIIAADRGISTDEIKAFNELRERQIPALVLVTSLMPEDGIPLADDRWDFDDITMLISRTLEKPVTPFLVLHDDAGMPIGLYDLKEDQVLDYSTGRSVIVASDEELREVVSEFKIEFDDEDFTDEDFLSGLRIVAIPFVPERGIGIDQSARYLTMLQQAHS